jgi:hypothetical protein
LFLKIGTKMLCLQSSGILFDRKIRLNNLVSQTIATSPRLLHTSIGILSRPIALPPFILFDICSPFFIFQAFLGSDRTTVGLPAEPAR